MFPERFSELPAYAFPRLRKLLDGCEPGAEAIHMAIGEPRHDPPDFVGRMMAEHASDFARYPVNEGTPELLESISGWLRRRYGVEVDPSTRIMALNGTREGLFNACLALCPETKRGRRSAVLAPNPFYQVYAVGALAAGAEPVFLPATHATGYLPDLADIPAETLDRATAFFLCSPSNPQGAVADMSYWEELLRLAELHDFRVFADECYCEIHTDSAPTGVLEAAGRVGADPERVVAFHSLSKRSNLPGLRSGFVVAGPESMIRIRQLRAYAGAPVPLPTQRVSAACWSDEAHVEASRARYRDKFALVDRVFADEPRVEAPGAGFFLWIDVGDGEAAALKLWRETGVRVLPGAYLGREVDGRNPGAPFIRAALVADEPELETGLTRLRDCLMRS